MTRIKYETYSQICNHIIGWSNTQGKLNNVNLRDIYGTVDNRTADPQTIIQICTTNYENNVFFSDDLCTELLECLIVDNKSLNFLPDKITSPEGNIFTDIEIVDMCHRVSAYEVLHQKSPKYININQNAGSKSTFEYFCSRFKTPNSIDDALGEILGKGYKYYYNSRYNNQRVIDRIRTKQGVNCTDSAHVFYRIGQALGYTVDFLHVQCKVGGHIRLRLKHPEKTGDKWIYRDPACVLSGKMGVGGNWCSNAPVIAYNPTWLFTNLDN